MCTCFTTGFPDVLFAMHGILNSHWYHRTLTLLLRTGAVFRRIDGQQGHRLRAGVFGPSHPRGHMSFCAFGWDVILYRQLPDAVLEFHDPSDCARYVWRGRRKHLVFVCSALNGIRLRFPHLFTSFQTMSSFMNQAAQRDVMHFITDCLRTQS